MMRRSVFGVLVFGGVVVAGLVGLAQQPAAPSRGAAPAAQRPTPAAPGTKSVGSVRDIMRSMVVPSSEVVFGAGAEAPKSAADWETLRLNAVELAESANLLMIGSRVRDRADWLKMARAQLDAAEAVVRLADTQKVDGLSEASDVTYETCTACHNKYWTDRNKAE